MLGTFSSVKLNIKNIQGKLSLGKKSLFETSKIFEGEGGINTEAQLDELKNNLQGFSEKFKEIRKSVFSDIKKAGLTKSFKFLCFFNAIYCLFVLIVFGFLSDSPELILNTASIKYGVVVSNILCLSFQAFVLRKDRLSITESAGDTKLIGFKHSLIYLLISSFFGLVIYLFNFFVSKMAWDNNYFDTILIIVSILVPSSHFIYYFFRAYYNSIYLGQSLSATVQKFENEYDKYFEEKVSEELTFHKKYHSYKRKSS